MTNIFSIRKHLATIGLFMVLVSGFFGALPQSAHAAGLVPCGGYTEAGEAEPECNFSTFMQMLNGLISWLLFTLAMPLAALMFAYAGFLYLTSSVNPEQREKAKKLISNIIWGLVIALAAWLIVHTILTSLGVDEESIFLSNPDDTVPTGDGTGAGDGAGAGGF